MSMLLGFVEAAARAKKVLLDPFTYQATWNPLGASASTPVTVPISADSDFLWMTNCLTVFSGVGVFAVNPDLLITFQDTGSSRLLQDQPTHVGNITGFGQWPYIWPEPKLLIGNGGLTITLINNTAVALGRVDFSMTGVKIFYKPGYSREIMIGGYWPMQLQ